MIHLLLIRNDLVGSFDSIRISGSANESRRKGKPSEGRYYAHEVLNSPPGKCESETGQAGFECSLVNGRFPLEVHWKRNLSRMGHVLGWIRHG